MEIQRGVKTREHAREDSDADFLVAFDGPANSTRYFGLQFYLEDLLGARSIWWPRRRCDPSCVPPSSATRSMSEASLPREWRFYVEDMGVFCDKVLTYTRGFERALSRPTQCATTQRSAISS